MEKTSKSEEAVVGARKEVFRLGPVRTSREGTLKRHERLGTSLAAFGERRGGDGRWRQRNLGRGVSVSSFGGNFRISGGGSQKVSEIGGRKCCSRRKF